MSKVLRAGLEYRLPDHPLLRPCRRTSRPAGFRASGASEGLTLLHKQLDSNQRQTLTHTRAPCFHQHRRSGANVT